MIECTYADGPVWVRARRGGGIGNPAGSAGGPDFSKNFPKYFHSIRILFLFDSLSEIALLVHFPIGNDDFIPSNKKSNGGDVKEIDDFQKGSGRLHQLCPDAQSTSIHPEFHLFCRMTSR